MEEKILAAINAIKDKTNKLYFYIPETGGNIVGSLKYTYDIALAFQDAGYNVYLFHEKDEHTPPKFGDEKYNSLKKTSFKEMSQSSDHLLSAADFIFVGELYVEGLVGSFRKNKIPAKIVIVSQSYDYILQYLELGESWDITYNVSDVLTTTQKQALYINELFPFVETFVVRPFIEDYFCKNNLPTKPFVAIQSRFPSDGEKLIKEFYLKYPFYGWLPFKTLGSLSQQDFANELKECCLAVWMDEPSSFGTFPLECMKCGVPVVGMMPTMMPEWAGNNLFWVSNKMGMVDEMALRIDEYLHNIETEDRAKRIEKSDETPLMYTEGNFKKESSEFIEKLITKRINQLEKLYGKANNNSTDQPAG